MSQETATLPSGPEYSTVVLWARMPPPVGGVTQSAFDFAGRLRDSPIGRTVDIHCADLGRTHYRLLKALNVRQPALHLFWAASVASLPQHAAIARLVRGRTVAFCHSIGRSELIPSDRRLRLSLKSFDAIWATNADLASRLGSDVEVVSAWSGSTEVPLEPRSGPRVLFTCFGDGRQYGLRYLVDALADPGLSDFKVTVLHYGGDGASLASIRRQVQHLPQVTVRDQATQAELLTLLADHDVLLRPTDHDGDSILVRQALVAGLTVLASDPVPRPSGVGLIDRSGPAIAQALLNGADTTSNGQGLGPSVMERAMRDLGVREAGGAA